MHTTVTEKHIYGKKVRTNNQNTDVILGLWEEFLRLDLKGDVYAVYSNYTSDFTEDYDLHIGTEEAFTNESSVTIPTGDYYVIEVDSTVPNAVYNAWLEIWNSDLQRAYKTDFEFYAKDGGVKIFLSIE
ncbi:AraC family transcriptional regulator [Lysinibacillus contaminans]|uniref:AraC family transcriptional regulator n=1 Tax=Lysinibacillus contaminans TaxID=1293441 RepID=A0ABR5K5R8_9BACI|nr:effector binding domain-containing protein [Lysinibacillus contaminans]KOS71711.1 AraC family transcriptional regulator [Lysinibacillus contaminans]